ncbi:MAG: DinB family protein [Candidatus Thorarchaeota archaeon]|nr:DinB family protein [Candidatus Thorarchaeota archaeon]
MDVEFFRLSARATRQWRDMELRLITEAECTDLAYRPRSGMSSLGWVLAHQAAVYDFSLNMLIKQGPPKNKKLFSLYTPGTSGDWVGTPLAQIQEYYDSSERDLLSWIETATEEELERRIEGGKVPSFFVGKTVREVLADTFTHLDYHTGHLTAIRKDWEKSRK